jgi:copper chaperone NosL
MIKLLIFITLTIAALSCDNSQSQPIKLHGDKCDYCAMAISDGKFGAELITQKGRTYKFDDLQCLQKYRKENSKVEFASFFVHDYSKSNILIDAAKAFYVQHESLNSPMRGNIAAFSTKEAAKELSNKHEVAILSWADLAQ